MKWDFAVRAGKRGLSAFQVNIEASDVYINIYDKDGSCQEREHVSYHASGQQHIKLGKDYRFQISDASGSSSPLIWFAPKPSDVMERQQIIGLVWFLNDYFGLGSWPIEVVPTAEIIDVPESAAYDKVLFQFNVVDCRSKPRADYFGHTIFWRKTLQDSVSVEIEGIGMHNIWFEGSGLGMTG
jgi:hypothetical protein